jgi:hypothetical protein
MRLAHALSSQTTVRPLPVLLVARGTSRVHEGDTIDPARALGVGPAKVLPQEHPGLRLAHIDVDDNPDVADLLLAELAAGAPEPGVALRDGHRYIEAYEPLVIQTAEKPQGLPEHPVVLITGGLGHMGINLSEAMFEKINARLVLIGRSALPEPDRWAPLVEDQATAPELRNLLKRLIRMRTQRDELLVLGADLNDNAQVAAAVDAAMPASATICSMARPGSISRFRLRRTGPEVVEANSPPNCVIQPEAGFARPGAKALGVTLVDLPVWVASDWLPILGQRSPGRACAGWW